MSCHIDNRTVGEEGNCMMIRLYPGHELPQFRELASKKCEKMGAGTED